MSLIDHRSPLPLVLYTDYQATDADMASLPLLPFAAKIRELRVNFNKRMTDKAMLEVGKLTNLERLWIDGAQLSDDGLEPLSDLTRLMELRLKRTGVKGHGLKHLRSLAALEGFHFEWAEPLQSGLHNLAHLRRLRRLGLNLSVLSAEAIRELGTLTQVEDLDLSNTLLTEGCTESLSSIGKMSELRKLDLHASKLNPSVIQHLCSLTHLERLQLTLERLDADDVTAVSKIASLQELYLPNVPEQSLRALTALKRLKLLSADVWSIAPDIEQALRESAPGLEIRVSTMDYSK